VYAQGETARAGKMHCYTVEAPLHIFLSCTHTFLVGDETDHLNHYMWQAIVVNITQLRKESPNTMKHKVRSRVWLDRWLIPLISFE
jgi:hypothetical protein